MSDYPMNEMNINTNILLGTNPTDLESFNPEALVTNSRYVKNEANDNGNIWDAFYLQQKFSNNRIRLLWIISLLISVSFFVYVSTKFLSSHGDHEFSGIERRSFNIDNIMNGEFLLDETTFRFIDPPHILKLHEEDPGLYFTVEVINDRKTIVCKQLFDSEFRKPITPTTFTFNGEEHTVEKIEINYRLDRAIIGTNIKKQFRHSTKGNYFIKDIETGSIKPVSITHENKSSLLLFSYVHFSPTYKFIYFNHNNDLYVQNTYSGDATRITYDGSDLISNAKPDWVYEEEVLATDKAIWWSADDSMFSFAQFDETGVESYKFPKFTSNNVYTPFFDIKYPKPGTANPTVELFLYNLNNNVLYSVNINEKKDSPKGDHILYDAAWIGSNSFLFKVSDRNSKILKVKVFDTEKSELTTTRVIDSNTYDGWIEKSKQVISIPPNNSKNRNEYGYLDIQADNNGFNHIFFFPLVKSKVGIQLTTGEWEITGSGILRFEYETDTIFFTSNECGPLSQKLYGAKLGKTISDLLTLQIPDSKDSYYNFEISSSGRYAVKKYLGPDIPNTIAGSLVNLLSNEVNSDDVVQITYDEELRKSMSHYDMPLTSYKEITLDDGVVINFVEIKPAKMNPKKLYPLLINVYGGPGSQTYSSKQSIQFEHAVVSGLDAIVLQIEPRGTGGKGWKFKSWAKKKLGFWEAKDITEVTKKFIETNKSHIDRRKVAIWGWSYGGFSTLKSIELDKGETFKYAMAVAPVTNWLLYDSIYTERYMDQPSENKQGYSEIARIKDLEGYGKLSRFLLVHGTADENVHIENTYKFIDQLDSKSIGNYDMHIYPDSDHSIRYHNALFMVYKKLYSWLNDAFSGRFE